MAKQKIEVEIGKKPAGKINHSKVGRAHPMPQKTKGEVSGQSHEWRYMICWNCSGISSVWYDTEAYHTYICPYCQALNKF